VRKKDIAITSENRIFMSAPSYFKVGSFKYV